VASSNGKSGLTIAQVLSWLNYGGVESYAIRLARGLQARGHRVIVVSSGGQLVPELEAAGIEHFQVDFTGLRMPRGAWTLRRLLERERVDLVNAHNWRAGMVSCLACRAAGVPYVLTVHGTRSPLHRHEVFYWSKRVVVVSEASRRNLVEGFGLPEERVVRSMIPVDSERFRPKAADIRLEEELSLSRGAPRIVHVSRFSHSKAPVALKLIDAMEVLTKEAEDVELILVGQGPQESAVAAEAEKMNRRLSRRAVLAAGGRGDIAEILLLGDVVVATATVALEGMACGKPVVAAGKAGYLGVVRPDNLARVEESCFGDHGELAPVTAERLAADVGRLLRDREEAARLGRFGREKTESRYALSRLAQEVEDIYRGALCERERVKRIVVFHLNQIGDLVFTLPALNALRQTFPEAHITSVLRPHLAGLVEKSGLVDEIVHRPRGGPWRAAALGLRLRRIRPDLAVVFSQSATMALCAWLSGARRRVGYVDSDLCRLLDHRVQVRGIPCPEKVLRLVRGLGLGPEKADYVGLIRVSEADEEEAERRLSQCDMSGDGPLVALAPGEAGDRPYKSWSVDGFRELARSLAADEHARLLVVGAERDRMLGGEVLADLEPAPRERCNLAGRTTPGQLAALLGRCDMLIGIDSGPMHVAAAMGTPVVALFGPTDPHRTGPQGQGHEVIFHRQECWRPCVHPVTPNCTERVCMSAITPQEVLAAARRILARRETKQASTR